MVASRAPIASRSNSCALAAISSIEGELARSERARPTISALVGMCGRLNSLKTSMARERLRLGKARAEIRQAAIAQRGGDRGRNPLGVEAFGDLRGGAADHAASEPVLVLHDLSGRKLQIPHEPKTLEQRQEIEGRVIFPPAKSLARAALVGMMIVVPALAHGDDGEKPIVAGIVAR